MTVQQIDNRQIKYKTYGIVDGKPRWIIVDENGKTINNNPNKEELKGLGKEPYGTKKKYTHKELLNILRQFEHDNKRIPTENDFNNDTRYPHYYTYIRMFGSWSKALKLAKLDVESMVKKGIIETSDQKRRFAEMVVIAHFELHPIDLAGEYQNSPCDGICPNGKTYDVKSSRFDRTRYSFSTKNKHKEDIEIYYFLAFNEDWTKLEYVWRVPGEIVEKDMFRVGIYWSEFNIDNMKEYDITDKFKNLGILSVIGVK